MATAAFVVVADPPFTVTGDSRPEGNFQTPEFLISRPVLDGSVVAASTGSKVLGFDIRTGKRRWSSAACVGGGAAAPVASREESILVVRCGTKIRSLDLQTGSFAWEYDPGDEWSMLRVGGGRIAIALSDHVDVVSLATGDRLFRWDVPEGTEEAPVVAVSEDRIYVGADVFVFSLRPDGKVRWEVETIPSSIWATSSEVLTRGRSLYTRFDERTGERIDPFDLDGTPSENSMFVADADGVAALASAADGHGVFGVDVAAGRVRWLVAGGRYVTGTRQHLVVDEAGLCTVRSVATGKILARCTSSRWLVGVDDDRVAYFEDVVDGGGTEVIVRLLPGRGG